MQANPSGVKAASFQNQKRSESITPEPNKKRCNGSVDQNPEPTYCVLVADRDSMSSDLLADAIRREGSYCAIAVPAPDLLTTLARETVDLMVIGNDVMHNTRSGLDLAYAASRAHPNLSLVVLLDCPTREAVLNAFRFGARGVCSRERPVAEFLDCIERVRQGFIWVQGKEATFLQEALRSIPAPSLSVAIDAPQLTSRQLQVVQYAAAGKTNKNIAAELRLSEHTVKNYLFRAFEKLGVSSRVELLFYLTLSGHSFSPTRAGLSTDSNGTKDLSSRLVIEHLIGKNNPQQDFGRGGGI